MEQQWFCSLLQTAKEEIKRLRAENTLMAARLEMFDNMMSVFNAQKMQQGRVMSPDIVYDIEKVIAEFSATKEKEVNPSTLCTDPPIVGGGFSFQEGSLAR
jgi:hypothetical protein